jgi:hypothetical protein
VTIVKAQGFRDSTVDFTRQPIIETVITPKDGYRLAVRSSKNLGQEEFVVEALEVVSFGVHCFFRTLDRSRAFLVPVSDYEVLEIREGRLPIKAASLEGTVKIPTVKEFSRPVHKEPERKEAPPSYKEPSVVQSTELPNLEELSAKETAPSSFQDSRNDRRKDRKRGQKKRRPERDETFEEERPLPKPELPSVVTDVRSVPSVAEMAIVSAETSAVQPTFTSSILPPPTTLIREDLERLRKSDTYKGAFYSKVPAAPEEEEDDSPVIPLSLQGDEEPIIKGPEEFTPVVEENTYKATPAPLEDDGRPGTW